MTDFDAEIDVCGMVCPMPLFKAKKAMMSLASGQVLHVVCDDKFSCVNFPNFAESDGHDLFETYEDNGHYHYFIRKK
ncbi:MAG: sulfurtransferase TusA family protein [Gammaproteobacteria bacterium]|nr:sulfurtransferase TusA family protein [Gammaproteobacteria bacterium]MDH5593603.1 sulfurtransferase TusA family protein [Gammaproteobacteria bacterium]MDH5613604.1 sulfurtransferase TusA family protein [Gammaproteobacteria bacterium]